MSHTRTPSRKHIRLVETNSRNSAVQRDEDQRITAPLHRVPQLIYSNLATLLWRQPSFEDIDLFTIVGAIAFADRYISRSIIWSRHLDLTIPVHNPDKWNQASIKNLLTEMLNYLSGDHWHFEFIQRTIPDTRAQQCFLPGGKTLPSQAVVMPFSGGLDSFSTFASFKEAGEVVYLINTETIAGNKKNVRSLIEAAGNAEFSARIPLQVCSRRHAEKSYRTRSFLFLVVTAIACKLAGGKRLVIPESGQGSLGPCLTRTGSEYPYRGMYPKFIEYVQRWLSVIWPASSITIEQPFIWNTKAQMLDKLARSKYAGLWKNTTSCPRNLTWSKTRSSEEQQIPPQCGVCSNCIQRRVALFHNTDLNFSENTEAYVWDDLTCNRFEEAHNEKPLRNGVTENDRDLAIWGILSHTHLSNLSSCFTSDAGFHLVKSDLCKSLGLPLQEVEHRLCGLLKQHHTEWTAFLGSLPPQSWVRQVARG